MKQLKEQVLKKTKVVIDIDRENTSKDELLEIYIDSAIDDIFEITSLKELPNTIQSLLVDMVVYQYRQRELENVTSETIGNTSYSFNTDYPSTITNRLKGYKRVTVV